MPAFESMSFAAVPRSSLEELELVENLLAKQTKATPETILDMRKMLGLVVEEPPVVPAAATKTRGTQTFCVRHNINKVQQPSGRWRCRKCRVEETKRRGGR